MVLMELQHLSECLDELFVAGPEAWADGASIEVLQRQLARLEAFVTAATAGFDASGEWSTTGARNAPAWLRARCHLASGQARRQTRLGRTLRHLPVTEQAWRDGSITASHAEILAAARRPGTEEAFARDEAMLVGYAKTMTHARFVRTVNYWSQLAAPDEAEDQEQQRHNRRDMYLEPSFDGMYLGRMTLDPISGAIVANELARLEHQLFQADWAEATERLGRKPNISDLNRTAGQRRADALVEMATRSATTPADGKRPEPLFSVFVGYETLHGRICELANGTVITPGSLVPWLPQAVIERAVFQPDNRVEVSAKSRLFTGATRRAIELRDRGCTHPYCDQPANTCQADHIIPYATGGATTQNNGRLLCAHHNRQRHQHPPP
jgi:5-methylcytosine-specific restriction endonuclease McrA